MDFDLHRNDYNVDGDIRELQKQIKLENQNQNSNLLKEVEEITIKDIRRSLTTDKVDSAEFKQIFTELLGFYGKRDEENSIKTVKKFLQNNPTRNLDQIKSANNENLLHLAIKHDLREMTEYLINVGSKKFLKAKFTVLLENTESLRTAFHQFSISGDVKMARLFISKFSSFEVCKLMDQEMLMESEGQRPRSLKPIHLACFFGNFDFLKFLHEHKVNLNITNNKRDTPILFASRNNHQSIVEFLINHRALVDVENDKGSTALYWAVRYQYVEMVKLLISKGKAKVSTRRKLGMETPITMATSLGNLEILKIMINNGADVNTKIKYGMKPIHIAAYFGHLNLLEYLLEWKNSLEEKDELGNTPLLLAIQQGKINVFTRLISLGANSSVRNKRGYDAWTYAMESENEKYLLILLKAYALQLEGHQTARISGTFSGATYPIHLASSKGSTKYLRLLFECKLNFNERDSHGNTFIHVAAFADQAEILSEFLDSDNVDVKNEDGNTPLHLALISGSNKAAEVILKKANLSVKNKKGETVLHCAFSSKKTSYNLLEVLVDQSIKMSSYSLIEEADSNGNTILHLIAQNGREELFNFFNLLKINQQNKAGNTELHVALLCGNLNVFDKILNTFNVQLDLNLQNKMGKSLLHIAAEKNHHVEMTKLIKNGANLGARDLDGNTVLHELVLLSYKGSESNVTFVFHQIVANVVNWWCQYKHVSVPDSFLPIYGVYKKEALSFLIYETLNRNEMNPLVYAAALGSSRMLEVFLNLEGVNKFTHSEFISYDITNIAPNTTIQKHGSSKTYPEDEKPKKCKSLLYYITRLDDLHVATTILNIQPIYQVAKHYWSPYQVLYIFLLLIHVLHMSLYGYYGIKLLPVGSNLYSPPKLVFSVFLVWPFFISIYNVLKLLTFIITHYDGSSKKIFKRRYSSLITSAAFGFVGFLVSSYFTSILWSSTAFIWFALYFTENEFQVHFLSLTLILGWLDTLHFTRGFQTIHHFSLMLKHMIVHDISKFIIVFITVLIGFSFTIRALTRESVGIAVSTPDSFDSIFQTFLWMVGMGDFFSLSELDQLSNNKGILVKITYISFIIFAGVILLNMLIAMMNDSYAAFSRGLGWKVRAIKFAIEMENVLFLSKFLNLFKQRIKRKLRNEDGKFYINIKTTNLNNWNQPNTNSVDETIVNLGNDIKQMKVNVSSLNSAIQHLSSKLIKE